MGKLRFKATSRKPPNPGIGLEFLCPSVDWRIYFTGVLGLSPELSTPVSRSFPPPAGELQLPLG